MLLTCRRYAVAVCFVAVLFPAACEACLTSLNDVNTNERNVTDPNSLREYILCPNTTFQLASTFDEDGLGLDGDNPILIARPNVHILCGDDGKSENKCVLQGGLIQLAVFDEYDSAFPATNSIVQGLTFSNSVASSINVLGVWSGNVIFRDCVFTNNTNAANMFFELASNGRRRRMRNVNRYVTDAVDAITNPARDQWRRRDQEQNSTALKVTVEGCLFRNNVVGSVSGLVSGLISSFFSGVALSVNDTTFVSNNNAASQGKVHYMIGNFEGGMELSNNCFIQSDVTISPVINQNSSSFSLSANYGELTNAQGPPFVCEFVANVIKGDPVDATNINDLQFSCDNFDSEACMSTTLPPDEEQTEPSCLTSLDEVYFDERDVDDSSVLRTYFLCPNTVFELANTFDENGLALDGNNPIIIARPNVYLLCGVDGKVDNNCTLQGGMIQLAVFDDFDAGELAAINVLVQGLTFRGASSVNVLASFNGDIVFRDCNFVDNSNAAAILQRLPTNVNDGKRRLSNFAFEGTRWFESGSHRIEDEPRRRREAQGLDSTLRISVASCVFRNNSVAAGSSQLRSAGVISNFDAALVVRDTLFVSNGVSESQGQTSYVVGNFEGDVELVDNCFQSNNVRVAPVVNQYGTFASFSNAGTTNTQDLCDFVFKVEDGDVLETLSDVLFDCFEYESDICPLVDSLTPSPTTLSPTTLPPTTPSPLPPTTSSESSAPSVPPTPPSLTLAPTTIPTQSPTVSEKEPPDSHAMRTAGFAFTALMHTVILYVLA